MHSSVDTDDLVRNKGFKGGLWELLRPFGERIQGKVTTRDSIGTSRTYEDFAVRFVQLGDGLEVEPAVDMNGSEKTVTPFGNGSTIESLAQQKRTGGDIDHIESLLDGHLTYAEDFSYLKGEEQQPTNGDAPSPYYVLYLRRLLSGIPLAPHETFSHPVACIIAISSRNPSPIEALRKLYEESSKGEKRLPVWVNNEYLRYYVLVHDEEADDITKSMALFDQMKRHFGLHCHLLRLRSSECIATDDDSIGIPRCHWLAASEEIAEIELHESQEDIDDSSPCIYESDTTAIKTFIREMVTQSVLPSMERCVATWNDQVASRRRGISGRFISLSKKWTVFGGTTRNSTSKGPASGSNSNYDEVRGWYLPDSPEAIMRKLADYAFMLRDWKLAQSTYELLRSDFNNDKAWKYHAAANEMTALSTLLNPQTLGAKVRSETVDQMFETASYSYVTRCGAPYGALRCLALGMELLKIRGGSATDDAAKWGTRLLEQRVVGGIGDALVKERIAACYASRTGAGSGLWGARPRKSALWSILAADAWIGLGKPQQSKQRLEEANRKYSGLRHPDALSHLASANDFLQSLEKEVEIALTPASTAETAAEQDDPLEASIMEESEAFDSGPRRRSIMNAPPLFNLESQPLHGTLLEGGNEELVADQFE